MSAPLLRVEGLHAFYGQAHILFDLSLEVGRGEVLALTGPNGAGKSTTLKALMGLLQGTQGRVMLDGHDITRLAPYQRARLGLGFVPEDRRIFTELSVLQNLETGRQPPRQGVPSWTVQALLALFPNLAAMPHRPGGRMSGGEQQMLTIARTLMGNPQLLLLDEPSEGVAPVIVEQMARMILDLKQRGLSILLCEQNTHFANMVSDRSCVLDQGRLLV
ncbi:branched-chain amino acid ABC transporter ATPase [Herbaspirillum sp. GW103]|uniref:ABC transporter ATP-binding protein n=1 Tax=unclassified Herbaspirillum TaxID=2624150 RepID=UPI00025E3581|nr:MULTISPECIES: ABC transporter ATP-binding protein [unclassified Herbaspirillum]EIJ47644.1 branched-chain amino acid ABC transporter ATPase [Herbaspirillum sp. GW103]MCI1006657.1 ABC transporter ATP-binding protein [Herbaspirillum sp. C7C8]